MAEFCMPSLGSDMEDGTLIEWEKQPGDAVHRGDVIAVVETQKGAIEVEVFENGILETVLVEIGDKVPVGTPLALIGDGTELVDTPAQTLHVSEDQSPVTVTPDVATPDDADRLRVSPAARRLALNSGIELSRVVGSGPDASIVLDDVEKIIAGGEREGQQKAQRTDDSVRPSPMDGMRDAIASAMSRSKREIPHYYLSHTVEIDIVQEYLRKKNAERKPEDRLVLGAVFIKAVALALTRYPEFNGYFDGGEFEASDAIHIGMAINIRGGGLVAPAIHHADKLSTDESMIKLKDLVSRVRSGRFRAGELSDPTITISSLGDRGVDSLYGVIYPPQVAIVGFGTPISSVRVDEGAIVPIHTITITLAADHRVSDGHRGSLLLRAIERYLQQPEKL